MAKKTGNYLTIKESRKIISYNIKQMKYYESLKKKKLDVSEYTSVMNDENNIIEIDNLQTHFFTDSGTVKSVNGVSFNIPKNKIIGVVGESGCGKSVTSLSIMQLVQAPQGQVVGGEIRFNSSDLGYTEDGKKIAYNIAKMPTKEMFNVRGKDITMIFQEPMTSLNPVFTIGYQLDEVMFIHYPEMSKEDVKAHTIEMLNLVGISMPERVYKSYPHELSGGMRQRVMIAMALAGDPKLIIADEPTTALDVTIQAQILELLKDIQKKTGCAIMLITHDLGVIAEMADEVVVMYAGKVIEKGTVSEIFKNPMHPYTIGLQKSKPLITSDANEPLYSIPGQVPNPINLPNTLYHDSAFNLTGVTETFYCDYPSIYIKSSLELLQRPNVFSPSFTYEDGDGKETVSDQQIIDEQGLIYYNPVTNTTTNITNWTYDYSDRSYTCTTENNTTTTITYGDEYITINEGDVNNTYITYNIYYYTAPEDSGDGSGSGSDGEGSGSSGSGDSSDDGDGIGGIHHFIQTMGDEDDSNADDFDETGEQGKKSIWYTGQAGISVWRFW